MISKIILFGLFATVIISGCTELENTTTNETANEQDTQDDTDTTNNEPTLPEDTDGISIDTSQIAKNATTTTNGTKHLASINLSDIVLGCSGMDCIKSIENPEFESITDADTYLEDNDRILSITFNGITRGYPTKILDRHEIVNDFFSEDAVLVSYCPLCGTGLAFHRTLDGEAVEFGVSGRLMNSDLIMYDRKTKSYWQQITGQAIVGELSGLKLKAIPMDTMQFKDFQEQYPNAKILKRVFPAGIYDFYPYGDYENNSDVFFPVQNKVDSRYETKAWTHGLEGKTGTSKAWPEIEIEKATLVNDKFDGMDLLITMDPETKTVRFFNRNVSNQTLTFELNDATITDTQTGSVWNFNGTARAGELTGTQLEQIATVRGFWFAWIAFHPNTEVFTV